MFTLVLQSGEGGRTGYKSFQNNVNCTLKRNDDSQGGSLPRGGSQAKSCGLTKSAKVADEVRMLVRGQPRVPRTNEGILSPVNNLCGRVPLLAQWKQL